MKEQKLILKDVDCFELDHIFDCGQCFRWNKQEDGSYIGVIGSGVLQVSKNKNNVCFEGVIDGLFMIILIWERIITFLRMNFRRLMII